MQWTLADQRGQRHRKQRFGAIVTVFFAFAIGTDIVMAQTQARRDIAVVCTGSQNVAADSLTLLCADLHDVLAAKYPDARFVLMDGAASGVAVSVTLEAFTLGKTGIEARLGWQARGAAPAFGPKMGFSISDSAMTPDMQTTFLSRLVHDTPLPF